VSSCNTASSGTLLGVEKPGRPKRAAICCLWFVWVVLPYAVSGTNAGAQAVAVADSDAQPGFVGEATCRGCHTLEAEHWSTTIHARITTDSIEKAGCESCHGPGSKHILTPSDRDQIIAFTRDSNTPVETMNQMCLACHRGGERIYWSGSIHERQDLACSDCHNPMAAQSPRALLAEKSVSQVCLKCHPTQRSEFRKRSHMPVLEGKVACSDCHQPHGSSTDPLLRTESVNVLCTGCHAEKRGPFIWEHAPVVESCLNCHHPHGSNHEALLVAPAPYLCNRCHGDVGSFGHPNDLLVGGNLANGARPDERLLNRGCVNCHAQIHGSNHPSGARFHR
jgi:DmsE family decaheme c-type cytochrome